MLVAVGMATAGIVGVWGVGFWSPQFLSSALTPPDLRGQPLPADLAQHIGRVKAVATILQDVGGFLGILTLNSEWQAYVLLPVVGYFTIGIMGGFVIYFPEIFPTRLRSTGTAFGYNVARLSAAVVMVLGNSIGDGFRALGVADPFRIGAVTLAGIYLLGLLVLLKAPETRGRPLMEDE